MGSEASLVKALAASAARLSLLAVGIFLLQACSASDGQQRSALSQAPIGTTELRGNYQKLAGCAYGKFVDGTSAVMQRNEFPELKQTRLTIMGGSLKAWELIFTQKTPQATLVELTSVQTIWGPDKLSTADVLPAVRSCELQK